MKIELSKEQVRHLFWALDSYLSNTPFETEDKDEQDALSEVYEQVSDLYIENCKY